VLPTVTTPTSIAFQIVIQQQLHNNQQQQQA
jgi:hypothetical protein